jgi:hypothetical protein
MATFELEYMILRGNDPWVHAAHRAVPELLRRYSQYSHHYVYPLNRSSEPLKLHALSAGQRLAVAVAMRDQNPDRFFRMHGRLAQIIGKFIVVLYIVCAHGANSLIGGGATSDMLVTGEFTNRTRTAALSFRLAPWTYDSASPAILERHHYG